MSLLNTERLTPRAAATWCCHNNLCCSCRWCGGDVAVTEHLDDLVQVISYTSAAAKEANRVLGISRLLVSGKPLPLRSSHGRVAKVAMEAAKAAADPLLPQEPLLPLQAAKAAALERALLLFKLLGNLHYWSPELPAQQQERFVRLMVGALRQSARSSMEFDTLCARVTENLKTLQRCVCLLLWGVGHSSGDCSG